MKRNDYYSKISAIADELRKYDGNDLECRPLDKIILMLDAIEVIAQDIEINFVSAQRILNDERISDALKVIRAFYVAVGRRLETQNACDILTADDPWAEVKSFHYYNRYLTLVDNEVRLAGFSAGDRVVFIGGGSVPLTSMLLNTCYGIEGISVEIVPQIADLSRQVLGKLGFGSSIEVVCGDEAVLADLKFDGVIVGASAEPKNRVFTNVRRVVSTETKILYRTYSGMRAILYPTVTAEDLAGFHESGRVLPTGKVNNTSVLISKTISKL
jgi:protein-L-isoaspartate O-methyltransferase